MKTTIRDSIIHQTIVVSLLIYLSSPAPVGAESLWRYVMPEPGAAMDHPPLRVLGLSKDRPADLKEVVRYRGKQQRYTQVRYGGPGSIRVTVVLDEIAPDEVDLYVDTHRARMIQPSDRLYGKDGVWRVKLNVAAAEAPKEDTTRTVLFKLGKVSRTLGYATCGYLEGKASLGARAVAVRRVDGDGNGLFADPQDRLWIDRDGDGRWDPLEEQFLFAPILTLDGVRYNVRSDPLGRRLEFVKLEGTGCVQVTFKPPELAKQVKAVTVTLTGRDGTVFSLRTGKAEATLPIGAYRITSVFLTLQDPGGGLDWSYVFSSDGSARAAVWHEVARGTRWLLDPVGELELKIQLDSRSCQPGDLVKVQPGLYTGDGLLINTAFRGEHDDRLSSGCGGEIVLATVDGAYLDRHNSGFA
jgi:hypothetical protein